MTALKQSPPIPFLEPHYRRPRVLHHYTSIASLLAILNSGQIWATHYQYLNDESEIKNFRGFLGQLLRVAIERSAEFRRRHAPLLSSLLNEVKNESNVYIASFSSIGDDNAMASILPERLGGEYRLRLTRTRSGLHLWSN